MQHNYILGWDIGGAHIKLAKATNSESISEITQLGCPLWRGLDHFHDAISSVHTKFQLDDSFHCVTMTGELVDCFNSRKEGVEKIVEQVLDDFKSENIFFFAGDHGLIHPHQTSKLYHEVASANWLASAKYVATKIENALFVDIGSTTCDVITIQDHKVAFDGYSDSERLYTQELVYCGVVRTPIFAICKSAPVKGKFIPVINEYFSNFADVYRLTQELPSYADLSETLDGRSKDELCSAARVARMFGYDYDNEEISIWKDVAKYIREQQIQMIINACRKLLATKSLSLDTPLVGAGIGRFLVKELALRLNREYIEFGSFVHHKENASNYSVADCAPAVSVACLGFQEFIE